MQTSIHGHEVIEMMLSAEQPYTSDSLVAAIHERFGPEARFHTCSAENMAAAELVGFLQSKGKFAPTGDGFVMDPARVCQH